MTMRFAPLAHLRSTQPTSHLQAYSAAGAGSDPDLVNVHGAGSFAESIPMQQFWRDANTAARHTALNTIIRYKVYGKALLGVDEVVTRLV